MYLEEYSWFLKIRQFFIHTLHVIFSAHWSWRPLCQYTFCWFFSEVYSIHCVYVPQVVCWLGASCYLQPRTKLQQPPMTTEANTLMATSRSFPSEQEIIYFHVLQFHLSEKQLWDLEMSKNSKSVPFRACFHVTPHLLSWSHFQLCGPKQTAQPSKHNTCPLETKLALSWIMLIFTSHFPGLCSALLWTSL